MIYNEKPDDFNSKFEIVSCYLEHNNHILLLHRLDHKPQGNTWGVVAGKIENGEDINTAILRELNEETGLNNIDTGPEFIDTVFVKYDDFDFIYHSFKLVLSNKPEININLNEHKDFKWVLPSDSLNMDLIPDLDSCIKKHYL